MIRVKTRNATYVVDRENKRWMRLSDFDMHEFDSEWVSGAFTIGGIGTASYAQFDNHPGGALGRWTSTVVDVFDPDGEVSRPTIQQNSPLEEKK